MDAGGAEPGGVVFGLGRRGRSCSAVARIAGGSPAGSGLSGGETSGRVRSVPRG